MNGELIYARCRHSRRHRVDEGLPLMPEAEVVISAGAKTKQRGHFVITQGSYHSEVRRTPGSWLAWGSIVGVASKSSFLVEVQVMDTVLFEFISLFVAFFNLMKYENCKWIGRT